MMRIVLRVLIGLLAVLLLLVAGAATYLIVAPPELLRVATGYSAKIVCSNVFLANRDPDAVLALDVQAPGHWLLKYVRVNADVSAGTVTARLLGLFATSTAIHRTGLGCASVPDGNIAAAQAVQLPVAPQLTPPPSDEVWPAGGRIEPMATPALADILGNPELTGQGMRTEAEHLVVGLPPELLHEVGELLLGDPRATLGEQGRRHPGLEEHVLDRPAASLGEPDRGLEQVDRHGAGGHGPEPTTVRERFGQVSRRLPSSAGGGRRS